jgi:hypothetical protein
LPGVRVEIVDGLDHRLPDDFGAWLVRALDDVVPRT